MSISDETWDDVKRAWGNGEAVQHRFSAGYIWGDYEISDRISRYDYPDWRVKPKPMLCRIVSRLDKGGSIGLQTWNGVAPEPDDGGLWTSNWIEVPQE